METITVQNPTPPSATVRGSKSGIGGMEVSNSGNNSASSGIGAGGDDNCISAQTGGIENVSPTATKYAMLTKESNGAISTKFTGKFGEFTPTTDYKIDMSANKVAAVSQLTHFNFGGLGATDVIGNVETAGVNGGGDAPFINNTYLGTSAATLIKTHLHPQITNIEFIERFSRKVFIGGLPPDIDEHLIQAAFRRFGQLTVDWPHKTESKTYYPPKGYAFLLFHDEKSVQLLISSCIFEDDKMYFCVSSPTIKNKPVQVRPWRLTDADYVLDATIPLDPRKTVFVGGVPRPLKAYELATVMDRLYGGVCYAGIDTDPELKYPKGAGRVSFSTQRSYIAAISARFVELNYGDIEKRVEVKPYVLDDQMCDECDGNRCGGKFAPFFCANVTCLRYFCGYCWALMHSRPGREYHKPLAREGADRPRPIPFHWF